MRDTGCSLRLIAFIVVVVLSYVAFVVSDLWLAAHIEKSPVDAQNILITKADLQLCAPLRAAPPPPPIVRPRSQINGAPRSEIS